MTRTARTPLEAAQDANARAAAAFSSARKHLAAARRALAILALTLAAGCDCGDPLATGGQETAQEAPACGLVELQHPASTPDRPCLYQITPAGGSCADVRPYVDGQPLPAESYDVICGAGQLVIRDASLCGAGHVVAVSTCPVER